MLKILAFNNKMVKTLIIYTKAKTSIWFLIKKNKEICKDLKNQINLLAKLVLI